MIKMMKTTSRMFCPSHTPAEEHDCDYDYQVSDGKSHKCTDDCNDKRWWWWLTTIIAMITMAKKIFICSKKAEAREQIEEENPKVG